MYEKKHWDGDLADLTGQCVKVGHEMVSHGCGLYLIYNVEGFTQSISNCL